MRSRSSTYTEADFRKTGDDPKAPFDRDGATLDDFGEAGHHTGEAFLLDRQVVEALRTRAVGNINGVRVVECTPKVRHEKWGQVL
jgi:hypothetical protein